MHTRGDRRGRKFKIEGSDSQFSISIHPNRRQHLDLWIVQSNSISNTTGGNKFREKHTQTTSGYYHTCARQLCIHSTYTVKTNVLDTHKRASSKKRHREFIQSHKLNTVACPADSHEIFVPSALTLLPERDALDTPLPSHDLVAELFTRF